MSRSDRGDRERCPRRGRMRGLPLKAFPLGGRWHGEAVTDEGAMIERFFVGPDALIGPLDGQRSTVPVLLVAHPIPSVATRHLPLTGGVGPGPLIRGLPLEVSRTFPARKIRSA